MAKSQPDVASSAPSGGGSAPQAGGTTRGASPSTQTVGSADGDGDGLSNADELVAGTDPTNLASALVFYPPEPSPTALVLNWQSATGRNYSVRSTAELANGFTNVVHSGIPADAPRNAATIDVSAVAGLMFYRIAAEAP